MRLPKHYSVGSEHSRYVIILLRRPITRELPEDAPAACGLRRRPTVATFEITRSRRRPLWRHRNRCNWRINGFEEKPRTQRSHSTGHGQRLHGVYIFNTQLLIPALLADARPNFET